MPGFFKIPKFKRWENTEYLKLVKSQPCCVHLCHCKGQSKVFDEEQNELQGVLVFRDCLKCSGRGYKRVPLSVDYQAIKHLVPDLNERACQRNNL